MSQEEIRQLLLELGGEGTTPELVDLAEEKYPNRTLHNYVVERLPPMKRKGIVREVNGKWLLTEKGENTKIDGTIEKLDTSTSESELREKHDINIVNIVGSLELNEELRLDYISKELEESNYHPETSPNLTFKPDIDGNMKILSPSSGSLILVGAESKRELVKGTELFLGRLQNLGISINATTNDILIQNIVATYDLDREIDLSVLAIDLGLEEIEYEPERFPGLIYRGSNNSTVILYRSGKVVITGSKTYLEVLESKNEIIKKLYKLGVEL
jgi:transcription initiation factor TFIID TATA-box-binding protein